MTEAGNPKWSNTKEIFWAKNLKVQVIQLTGKMTVVIQSQKRKNERNNFLNPNIAKICI